MNAETKPSETTSAETQVAEVATPPEAAEAEEAKDHVDPAAEIDAAPKIKDLSDEVPNFLPPERLQELCGAFLAGAYIKSTGETEFAVAETGAIYNQLGELLAMGDEAFRQDLREKLKKRQAASQALIESGGAQDREDAGAKNPTPGAQRAATLSAAAVPPEDRPDPIIVDPDNELADLDAVTIPGALSMEDLEAAGLDTGPRITYSEAFASARMAADVCAGGDSSDSDALNAELFRFGLDHDWPVAEAFYNKMVELSQIEEAAPWFELDQDLRTWIEVFVAVGQAMAGRARESREDYDEQIFNLAREARAAQMQARAAAKREAKAERKAKRPELLGQAVVALKKRQKAQKAKAKRQQKAREKAAAKRG